MPEPHRLPEPSRTPEPHRTPGAWREDTAPDGPPAPDTVGGLPRRVRQASLAPQLREDSVDRTPHRASPVDPADDVERDADEVRDRMASLQSGWQRGRRQNAETEYTKNTEDAAGPGGTAPGTTPGGDGR